MNPSSHWGLWTYPNLELWDEFFGFLAQSICQQRAHMEPGPADNHIVNPAGHNSACDWCWDISCALMYKAGLLKLLQVYGSVAYASGRAGVPEPEAARRTLQEAIERAHQIQGATEFLAQVFGKDAWWQLPLERDERWPSDDDEETDGLCFD